MRLRLSKHHHVENTDDFTQWDWGDPPDHAVALSDKFIDQLKELASDIAAETHAKSCAIGAAVAFEELAENAFFVLRGVTDKGLLVEFLGTDQFVVCDELEIVDEAVNFFDDPQHVSAHLRRLADAIDAGSREEQSPP